MITFKKINFKNFLSAGNKPIQIDLNRNKSTLIVGHNGAGKSTILDALSFALFGKPHRSVKKNQLVNSVNNKGALIEVWFETSGHEFKIVRGIKPNIFEIWQDDKMIDQSASVRDYQKFLEQNILKLTHKSFHQIVVLGSSSFIPFMQLPPHHRREVIEDLLDINIFGKMKQIVKEKNQSLKANLRDTKALVDSEKSKIAYQAKHIDTIRALNVSNSDKNKKIDETLRKDKEDLIQEGIELVNKINEYKPIKDLKSDLNNAQNTKDNLNQVKGQDQNTLKQLLGQIKFFESNESCPTCQQMISNDLKNQKIEAAKSEGADISDLMHERALEMTDVYDNITSLQGDISALNEIKSELKNIQINIEMITNSLKEDNNNEIVDLTKDEKELKDLNTQCDEYRDLFDEYSNKLLYNEAASEMLKDTGIRTKVVKEYLPAMNMLINQYLQTLDFFVHFHLDENFDETIKSRHRDTFVYANFSEGEKTKIDVALMFAWRQIAKMKNSTNTNLLILDETFDSSLDTDSIDNLMKILHSLGTETNTFVISHKSILGEKMDTVMEFKKVNNFSTYSYV